MDDEILTASIIVWSFISLLVLGRPIAMAAAKRLAAGAEPADQRRLDAPHAELEQLRARLSETEDQLGQTREKLGFVERLLEKPIVAGQIPTHPSLAAPGRGDSRSGPGA